MARVCNAGHGGQILLTEATRSGLVGMPKGVGFRALGEVSLQGLPDPESLYQVTAAGLIADFPPLRAS
jgi:class 3 adenylate cyclase